MFQCIAVFLAGSFPDVFSLNFFHLVRSCFWHCWLNVSKITIMLWTAWRWICSIGWWTAWIGSASLAWHSRSELKGRRMCCGWVFFYVIVFCKIFLQNELDFIQFFFYFTYLYIPRRSQDKAGETFPLLFCRRVKYWRGKGDSNLPIRFVLKIFGIIKSEIFKIKNR